MPNKCLRLKLFPPDYPFEGTIEEKRESWKSFKNTIWNACYQNSIVKNRVAQAKTLEMFSVKSGEEKERIKVYDICKKVIQEFVEEYQGSKPVISAVIASANARCVEDTFKAKKKDIWNANCNVPSFRRDGAIALKAQKITDNDKLSTGSYYIINENTVRLSLWSGKAKNKYHTGQTNYDVNIAKIKNNSQLQIIKRLLTGEYTLCGGRLQIKDGEVYLIVGYEFEKEISRNIKPGRVLGVDLGIKKIACCACNDNKNIRHTINDEVAEALNRYRWSNQRNKSKACRALRSDNGIRAGHGRKNKLRTLDFLSGKDRNYMKTLNENICKMVINFALKNSVEIIAVEDLKGIYESSKIPAKKLRRWAYYELQTMIETKCKEYGIGFIKVNPRNTSRTCNACGYIDKNNRKSQANFECLECGNKDNADMNAAKNIADLGYKNYFISATA